MSTIAINTRFLLPNKLEGIGWFSYEVLKRWVEWHPEHEFIFIFDRAYDEQFVFGSNVKPIVASPQARHPVLFYLWFEWALPAIFKKQKAYHWDSQKQTYYFFIQICIHGNEPTNKCHRNRSKCQRQEYIPFKVLAPVKLNK
jgi:hypothetical protein